VRVRWAAAILARLALVFWSRSRFWRRSPLRLGFVADPPKAALVIDGAPRSRDVVILELGRPRLARRGRRMSMPVRLVPSLFVDAGAAQSATVVVEVNNLSPAILAEEFANTWTITDLDAQLKVAPVTMLQPTERGVVLLTAASVGLFGLTVQVINNGLFSIPIG
jgi:hypothetical protein